MAKRLEKLTAATVDGITEPGRYSADCHGLALLVRKSTKGGMSMSWAQRIKVDGRTTNLGLGPYPLISIKLAKQHATANAVAIHCNEPSPLRWTKQGRGESRPHLRGSRRQADHDARPDVGRQAGRAELAVESRYSRHAHHRAKVHRRRYHGRRARGSVANLAHQAINCEAGSPAGLRGHGVGAGAWAPCRQSGR